MNDRLIQLVAVIVLAGGLLAAAMLSPGINRLRVDRQLTYDTVAGDDTNAQYTLLASTGAFRGIAINFAWHRIETLKQEGKFAEANDLAKFIVSLQPRFPGAWEFMAWNMAYNISVKSNTQEERWYWVNNGLSLLREEGIPNNPRSILLYKQLGWILSHKMGGRTDDMHWYYKRQFAQEWEEVLGAPLPGRSLKDPSLNIPRRDWHELLPSQFDWDATAQFADVDDMAQAYLRRDDLGDAVDQWDPRHYFTALSPESQARFYKDFPGLERVVRELRALRGPAGEDLGLGLNTTTLRAFGRIALLQRAGYNLADEKLQSREGMGAEAWAVYQWLRDQNTHPEPSADHPRYFFDAMPRDGRKGTDPLPPAPGRPADAAPAMPDPALVDLDPLLDLLRAQTLIDQYYMDPAYMRWLMNEYGPIDWRHVHSHALYWSSLGTLMAEELIDKSRVDVINNDRQTLHAIQGLAYGGTLAFRPKVDVLGDQGDGVIFTMADTRFIEAYASALARTRERIASGEFGDLDDGTYETGYENFLHSAIMFTWYGGATGLARYYWDLVQQEFGSGNPDSNSVYRADYEIYDLPTFAYLRLVDDDLYESKTNYLTQLLMAAWREGMLQRDPEITIRKVNASAQFYAQIQEDYDSSINTGVDTQQRMDLPEFNVLLVQTFIPVITDPSFSLVERASMWEVAAQLIRDPETRYQIYSQMVGPLTTQLQLQGYDADFFTAFRMPAGYPEWVSEQQRLQQEQEGNDPGATIRQQ